MGMRVVGVESDLIRRIRKQANELRDEFLTVAGVFSHLTKRGWKTKVGLDGMLLKPPTGQDMDATEHLVGARVVVVVHLLGRDGDMEDVVGRRRRMTGARLRDETIQIHRQVHRGADAVQAMMDAGWVPALVASCVYLVHPEVESAAQARRRLFDLGLIANFITVSAAA